MAKMRRTRGEDNSKYVAKDWFHDQMVSVLSKNRLETEGFSDIVDKVAKRLTAITKLYPDEFGKHPCPAFGIKTKLRRTFACRKVSCPWCFARIATRMVVAGYKSKAQSTWIAVRKIVTPLPTSTDAIVGELCRLAGRCRLTLDDAFLGLGATNVEIDGGACFQWLRPLAKITESGARYDGTEHHAATLYVGSGDLFAERVGADPRPISELLRLMQVNESSPFEFRPYKDTSTLDLLVRSGHLAYPSYTLHPEIFSNPHFSEARAIAGRLRASRAFRQYVSSGCLVSDADK